MTMTQHRSIMASSTNRARRLLAKALEGRPQRIKDKSAARYVLFHAPPDTVIRNTVLRLLPRHPEHIEAFVFYLGQFRLSKAVIDVCSRVARQTPYRFVQGEILRFLATVVSINRDTRRLCDLATSIAKDRDAGVAAKWGAIEFLCRCEEIGLGAYSRSFSGSLASCRHS